MTNYSYTTYVTALRQRGLALFFVLISLAILSLAALGLIRSVDTATLILGNLGFKQTATSVSDRTVEIAVTWLNSNSAGQTLFNDYSSSSVVYYASSAENLDLTGNYTAFNPRRTLNWGAGAPCSGTYVACLSTADSGITGDYTSRFFIERLCRTTGDFNGSSNSCVQPMTGATSSPKRGEIKYGEDKRFASTVGPFYRIVVRTVGPRNTVSFTETYIHL